MDSKLKKPIIEYSADYSEYSISNEYSNDYSEYSPDYSEYSVFMPNIRPIIPITAFLAISPRFRSAPVATGRGRHRTEHTGTGPIATGTERHKIAREEFYLISVLKS